MLTTLNAKMFAAGAHAALGQKYGDGPYVNHLNYVVGVLHEFRFEKDSYSIVAYFHDLLEDTKVTAQDLVDLGLGLDLVGALLFVTDCVGANRKTRKAATYRRVRDDIRDGAPFIEIGLAVKWADRIANLRNCVESHPRLLSTYIKEAADFRAAYFPPFTDERWDNIIAAYDNLIIDHE